MKYDFKYWLINYTVNPRYLMKKIANYLEKEDHGNKSIRQLELEVKAKFNAYIKIYSIQTLRQ